MIRGPYSQEEVQFSALVAAVLLLGPSAIIVYVLSAEMSVLSAVGALVWTIAWSIVVAAVVVAVLVGVVMGLAVVFGAVRSRMVA
jgi:hypothetical protein